MTDLQIHRRDESASGLPNGGTMTQSQLRFDPKPETRNPKPEILNPTPSTLKRKANALSPKPQILNPKL